MLIDGVEYHINILILLMENEIETTIHTVETLLEGIEDGVTVSILLNGGRLKELHELFSKSGCIRYYESEINLGVAGGRNYLLQTAECKSSDIVMILDNDVVPPMDYVRNLATFLIKQKDAGIVGAIVADIGNIPYRLVVNHYGDTGFWGN
ncbi:MAG: glycosyltransferase, partial [Thermodesulfobacteriota bacterium]